MVITVKLPSQYVYIYRFVLPLTLVRETFYLQWIVIHAETQLVNMLRVNKDEYSSIDGWLCQAPAPPRLKEHGRGTEGLLEAEDGENAV